MPLKKNLTVIMPFYKKIEYFKIAYSSVVNQTYKNFNVILVYDDELKEDLKKIKRIIKSKNFKLIVNKKNIGAGPSRNKAIDIVKTKYIAFLDCDDYWEKNKLKYQLNLMKKYKLKFSHTSYNIFNSDSNKIKKIYAKKKTTYNELLKSCDIGLSTVIIESNILKNFRFGNTKTKEDYILWLKLAKNNINIFGIKKLLSNWRKDKKSLSSNVFQKLKDAFIVYFRYEKFNFILSCLFTIRLSLNYLIKHYLQIKNRV